MSSRKFRGRPRNNFKQNQRTGPRVCNQNQLSETDVGITKFISELEGFSGIIKARFSDFHVNEIDLDGKAAILTNQSIPEVFLKEPVALVDSNEIKESPLESIPQSIWESLKKLATAEADCSDIVELDATTLSKEERTKIHELLNNYFPKKIAGNTKAIDEKKVMQFKKYNAKDPRYNNLRWPVNEGEYVHFMVYKESLDTLDACMKIADCLRTSPSNFNYAGVKDKRAKTTQWFSIRKVNPKQLLSRTKPIRNIKIGNVTLKDKPLKLGHLQGNKFRIALRNVTGSDELIEKSMNSIKDNGFINYYGLQRFGNNKEVPTYSIGVELLLGNWKKACDIILKTTESDDPDLDVSKAKRIYKETRDVNKALAAFTTSRNRCVEYKLLFGLSKGQENDIVNALENIPRNMRLLYLHSFQSLVWNLAVSKRIEHFGLKPVEGDFVLLDEKLENMEEKEEEDSNEESQEVQVKQLTAEDCSNYTIYDIVLPLPGYDVIYPENCKSFYKEILESYGLSLEMTKQKVRTYNLSGAYRKILGRIQDLSWKIIHYNDPNDNLIQSDYEALKGVPEPVDLADGKYKALVMEFSLNSSCYATMVLREVLKTDTSSSSQAKLNHYHSTPNTVQTSKVIVVKEGEEEKVNQFDQLGLLDDAKKYEEFKKIVLGPESVKRKCDNEEENENSSKKTKLE